MKPYFKSVSIECGSLEVEVEVAVMVYNVENATPIVLISHINSRPLSQLPVGVPPEMLVINRLGPKEV